ncbi:MAG: RagB/SusD family nutrient uptake outer membrane protein [Mangrovibacterium sp.]
MKKITVYGLLLTLCFACNSYLDVVPDNIATIDNAFTDRNQAEKALFTLYSYLPEPGRPGAEGRFDDMTWTEGPAFLNMYSMYVLRDGNRASNPYNDYWVGGLNGQPLFRGIRDCNTFLEKIDEARGLDEFEKLQWIAEAKFLKAFYHFYLLQLYGPIPVVKNNVPITASNEEVMVKRLPIDTVFNYIYSLIDEAIPDLLPKIGDITLDMGRISRPVAMAMKAKIAVIAASPLFNGNTTYAGFKDQDGKPFFSQEYSADKWKFAVDMCKTAIDTCLYAGHDLYHFEPGNLALSEETQKIIEVGRIFTDKWNVEHIWGFTNPSAVSSVIDEYTGTPLDATHSNFFRSIINPTLKASEMFYSKNGVPIDEDKDYDYAGRYDLVTTTAADSKFLQTGYTTVKLHRDRECRFYGSIACDGGWWYGLSKFTETGQWPVNTKSGSVSGQRGAERFSCSGYYIKKLINMENSFNNTSYVYNKIDYPYLRMADLYLLYAEALNEWLDTPDDKVYHYVNLVRERAGLETVQVAWENHSLNPEKYQSKTGMRDIIRQERSIELAFEGHRFFDLRRWNMATTELNGAIRGWNYMGSTPADFYQPVWINSIVYNERDVLWPIASSELTKNKNLIQNPGW